MQNYNLIKRANDEDYDMDTPQEEPIKNPGAKVIIDGQKCTLGDIIEEDIDREEGCPYIKSRLYKCIEDASKNILFDGSDYIFEEAHMASGGINLTFKKIASRRSKRMMSLGLLMPEKAERPGHGIQDMMRKLDYTIADKLGIGVHNIDVQHAGDNFIISLPIKVVERLVGGYSK